MLLWRRVSHDAELAQPKAGNRLISHTRRWRRYNARTSGTLTYGRRAGTTCGAYASACARNSRMGATCTWQASSWAKINAGKTRTITTWPLFILLWCARVLATAVSETRNFSHLPRDAGLGNNARIRCHTCAIVHNAPVATALAGSDAWHALTTVSLLFHLLHYHLLLLRTQLHAHSRNSLLATGFCHHRAHFIVCAVTHFITIAPYGRVCKTDALRMVRAGILIEHYSHCASVLTPRA